MINDNTGNQNTDERNTGDCNTGYRNTGHGNTGSLNTGHGNTGSLNTGNRNTGDWNTGNRNAGDWNTGHWNTGNWNTGNCNTGSLNTGDWNTGHCNSITPDDILIFNKPAKRSDWDNADKPDWLNVNLTQWITEANMTDSEKEAYPSYVTTDGYLKSYTSLKAAFVEAWENTTQEDREKTFKLPNFDVEVFKEVFGFNPYAYQKKKIVIDGREVELDPAQYEQLQKMIG